jgi:hypothetical protein
MQCSICNPSAQEIYWCDQHAIMMANVDVTLPLASSSALVFLGMEETSFETDWEQCGDDMAISKIEMQLPYGGCAHAVRIKDVNQEDLWSAEEIIAYCKEHNIPLPKHLA